MRKIGLSWYFVCLALCLSAEISFAQRLFLGTYGTEQGLPQSELWSVFVDKRGYLWGGTNGGGLVRFRGNGFEVLDTKNGLPSNQTRPEFQDKQDRLWINTFLGIACYDGLNFKSYGSEKGLSVNGFNALYQDDAQNIWLIDFVTGVLKRFENEQFNPETRFKELENKPITFSSELQNGRLYLFVSAQESYFLHKNRLERVTLGERFKELAQGFAVLFEQKDGTLWLQSNGICYLLKDNQLRKLEVPEGLVNNFGGYKPFWEAVDGKIWIATARSTGVYIYEKGSFTALNESNVSNRFIVTTRCITGDKDGNIWFGTSGRGILRYSGAGIQQFWPNDAVRAFARDREDNFWVGTLGSAIKRNPNGTEERFLKDNPNIAMVKHISEDANGRIYLSTMGGAGIFAYKNGQLSNVTQELMPNLPAGAAVSFVKNIDKDYWLGTWGVGLFRKSGAEQEVFNVANGKSKANVIHSLLHDTKGRLWIGTNNGLICRNGNDTKIYAENSGILNCICISISEDKNGTLWVATYGGGLHRLNGERFEQFNTSNSKIESDILYSVISDEQGNLWIGTQNGINHIVLDEKSQILNIRHYDKADGFLTNETNGAAIYKDKDGSIWFGTIAGAFRCDPALLSQKIEAPKVAITNIRLFFKPIDWLSDVYKEFHQGLIPWLKIPQFLKLPYAYNHISFDFEAVHYKTPEKVLLQWQLEGIDAEWSPESQKTEASYPNLPHGAYVFKVRARHHNGDWTQPIRYEFTVSPPWYRLWWVQALGLCLFIGIILAIFRARTASLKQRQLDLERIVNEKTAEVRLQNQHILLKNTELEQQKEEILIQAENLKQANLEIVEKSLLINQKNQDITASILYAQRIQRAMLPFTERIAQVLDDFFVFYKPRDIVSGDFYWFADLTQANIARLDGRELSILVVSDCTGHGVPGAFMSMIGNQLLYEIIIQEEIFEPNKILVRMSAEIVRSLRQEETLSRDGMDIGILLIDKTHKKLFFAGANNDLFLVQDGVGRSVRGDRWGLGGVEQKRQDFILNTIDLNQPTVFFLYSDGYQDQFGGEKGRKFMSRNFRRLLENIASQPAAIQHNILEKTLQDWTVKQHRQVDDILIFGARLEL